MGGTPHHPTWPIARRLASMTSLSQLWRSQSFTPVPCKMLRVFVGRAVSPSSSFRARGTTLGFNRREQLLLAVRPTSQITTHRRSKHIASHRNSLRTESQFAYNRDNHTSTATATSCNTHVFVSFARSLCVCLHRVAHHIATRRIPLDIHRDINWNSGSKRANVGGKLRVTKREVSEDSVST